MTPTTYVLDASAMIAYLNGEPGGAAVETMLADAEGTCFAHAVNLCEVYYDVLRARDEKTARKVITDLLEAGIVERRDISRRFWTRVGRLKARGRVSLADCFCVALSQQLSAELVTADHHEFDRLVPLGIATIHFIR